MSLANQGISGSQGRMRIWVLLPEIPVKSSFKVGNQNRANTPLLCTEHMYIAGAEWAKLPCPGFQGGHLWHANWTLEQRNMHPLAWPASLLRYCTTVSIYGCIYFSVLVQISWSSTLKWISQLPPLTVLWLHHGVVSELTNQIAFRWRWTGSCASAVRQRETLQLQKGT